MEWWLFVRDSSGGNRGKPRVDLRFRIGVHHEMDDHSTLLMPDAEFTDRAAAACFRRGQI